MNRSNDILPKTRRIHRLIRPLVLILLAFWSSPLAAQCAMCTKAAMDGMKDGATTSAGINDGILYLLALPYVLFFSLAGVWFYLRRKARQQQEPVAAA